MAEAQNIPAGSTTAGSIAVAAESTVATRMSAPPSFDVADFPVPHGREEEWRFTPLERLRGLHDGTAVATGGAVKVEVERPRGRHRRDRRTATTPRLGKAGTPVDRVAAQAYSSFEKASVVTVAQGDRAHRADPDRRARRGRYRLRPPGHRAAAPSPRPSSSSTTPVTRCVAANVDYLLGDGAKLTVVSVQDWDDTAVHVAQHNALIGRDATFKSIVVTFGGDLVRLHPRVAYAGPGGEAELFGLYFTDTRPAPGAPPPGRPQRPALQVATSSTRARSRARTRTPSGSVTSSSRPRPRAPTRTR